MNTIQVAIRQTCDSCSESKVKCDGGLPCKRCQRRGTQCFYRPKKRRTKIVQEKFEDKGKNIKSNIKPNMNDLPKSLNEYERRSWSVFFTLFRNLTTSCSSLWFSHQLRNMLKFLEQGKNQAAEKRFHAWLDALNIEPITAAEEKRNCDQINCNMIRLQMKPSDRGVPIVQNVGDVFNLKKESEEKNIPMLELSEKSIAKVNQAFVDFFGVSEAEINQLIDDNGGGLLPWGGDVICRLIPKENDILAFIQILAIKMNSLGKPETIPCVREIPSIHVVTVAAKNNTFVDCVIKCVHREIISKPNIYSISMQMCMTFSPLQGEIFYENVPSSTISNEQAMNIEDFEMNDVLSSSISQMNGTANSFDQYEESPSNGDTPDLLSNDYLGDDEKWLDELLSWAGNPQAFQPNGTTAEHLGDNEFAVGLPFADETITNLKHQSSSTIKPELIPAATTSSNSTTSTITKPEKISNFMSSDW